MQSARIVSLNSRSASAGCLLLQRLRGFRRGGLREVAPRIRLYQAHGEQFNRRSPGCTSSYGWQAADFAKNDNSPVISSGVRSLTIEVCGTQIPLGGASSCETYLAFGQDEGVILGFGCKRLADEIAGKAADRNVPAEVGNFRAQQIFDRDRGVFHGALFEQTDRAVKLVQLSIDNFLSHVRGLSFDLRLVNLTLGLDQFSGHVFATDIKRVRRRNV